MPAEVRFGLLGPLLVRRDTVTVVPSSGKQRIVLAALLLNAGRAVSVDELVELLWDEPPASARVTLQNYVKRLRQALHDVAPERIVTRPDGYLLHAETDEVDTALFTHLVTRGRAAALAGSWDTAAERLHESLRLWRGAPLVDVFSDRLRERHVPELDQLRVDATEWRVESDLRRGRHEEVVAELRSLVAAHPLRERLRGQLILALYRCGRQAEAQNAFRDARRTLVDELGVEPGADLQRLYHQILTADPALTPAGRATPTGTVPAQLPADLVDFTGRRKLVDHMVDLLTTETEPHQPGVVLVASLSGGGGVGKTSLAVHVGHQVRRHFTDGQLYADLGGVDQRPAAPEEVLARFLRGLGADPAAIPADREERAAAYRSALADRRVLIVLDNARDAAQVRPLLPGTPSCRVMVTSRLRMPELDADLVDLDVLGKTDAYELFARIVGMERVLSEPDAVGDVVRSCAGLPLALRIAARRLVGRAGWSVRTLADRLTGEHRRLDELAVGDLAVRGTFAVSYDDLPRSGVPDLQRCFRLLGLPGGTSVGLPAACALLDDSVQRVERAIGALVDMNLVQYQGTDRYRLHDLVRVYAVERADTDESPAARAAALTNLHMWYLRTAIRAARVVNPGRRHPTPAPGGEADHVSLDFDTYDQALAWLDTEYPNLVATVFQAERERCDEIAWQLAIALFDVLHLRGHFTDWIATHRVAIEAARRCHDRPAEGWLLCHLSVAFSDSGRPEAAIDCLREALDIDRETGNRRSEAVNLTNLGYAYIVREDYESAIEALTEAMVAGEQTGHLVVAASAANNVGFALKALGRLAESVPYLRRALEIARANDMRQAEGNTLTELAEVELALGDVEAAVDLGQQAVAVNREVGNRLEEANALRALGRALRATDQTQAARRHLAEAAAIYAELDLPQPTEP